MAFKNANGEYFRYALTDDKYKILDGADTVKGIKELARTTYNDVDVRVVKIDANGYINGIVIFGRE